MLYIASMEGMSGNVGITSQDMITIGENNNPEIRSLEVVTQIYTSYDYSILNDIKGNRKHNLGNIAKLRASMNNNQHITPILVNEKMEIIDGSHRYRVCKDLGLPIYFYIVEGYGLKEVQDLNTVGVKWTSRDFLESRVSQGDDNYVKFNRLMQEYSASVDTLIKILCKLEKRTINDLKDEFIKGRFIFTDESHKEIRNVLDMWLLFSPYKYCRNQSFISALLDMYFEPTCEKMHFEGKVKQFRNQLINEPKFKNKCEYLAWLCNSIYSSGNSKRNIYYNAQTKTFHK